MWWSVTSIFSSSLIKIMRFSACFLCPLFFWVFLPFTDAYRTRNGVYEQERSEECVVGCKSARLIGSRTETRGGRAICSYKGIYFGKPPINHLRFQDPEPLDLPEGTVYANEEGQECVQRASLSLTDIKSLTGGENCLNLNVYACTQLEDDSSEKKTVPVIVFIHGGGWLSGSNKQSYYGPEYLCDKDVVYVAVNYRLGFFGFMTSGDEHAPGNLGLKDMALALKWVHDHIACFGGDPNQVTVTGESVGAVCSVYLSISPWSKDFVDRRVSFSGCEGMPVAFRQPEEVADPTKKIAAICGCPTHDSKAMIACLQRVPYEIIFQAERQLGTKKYPPYILMYFMPILDNSVTKRPFLPFDPRTICTTKPWIHGSMKYDGSYFVGHFGAYPHFLKRVLEYPCDYIADLLYLSATFKKHSIATVSDRICRYYFQYRPTSIRQLIKLFTDSFFFIPGVQSALKYQSCGKAYIYIDKYYIQSRQTWNNAYGPEGFLADYIPGHTDILSLYHATYALFNRTLDTPLDVKVSKAAIEYLYTFAKHGDPRGEHGMPWDVIGSEHDINYLSIDRKIEQKRNPDYETVEFWKKLVEEYGNAPESYCKCIH